VPFLNAVRDVDALEGGPMMSSAPTGPHRSHCERPGCFDAAMGILCEVPEHRGHDDDADEGYTRYPKVEGCTVVCDWHGSTEEYQVTHAKPGTLILVVPDPRSEARFSIDPGSGIVTADLSNQQALVYFEGNRSGAENIITLADRADHAADRLVQQYPTIAKSLLPSTLLHRVGVLDLTTGTITVDDDAARVKLATWMRVAAVADAELLTTSHTHTLARTPLVLRRHNRLDQAYQLPAAEIAAGLLASPFGELFRGGWPLDRALRSYLAANEEAGGLQSAFEAEAYAGIFEAVRELVVRAERTGARQ
jgi:hypothetical protein